MALRTLAALLALLAAAACTGGDSGPATPTPEATPTAATPTPATPTPEATPTAATPTPATPTPEVTPTAAPTPDATTTPDASPTAQPPPASSPTPAGMPGAAPAPDASTAPGAPPTATPPPEPRTRFGNGEWRVGVDIAPGRYSASAEYWTAVCRWSTGSGRAGRTTGDAWTLVEIAPADRTFLSRGCSEWTARPTPSVEPGQPFGDGDYLVGADIAPGRYRTTTATESCVWWTGALANIKSHRSAATIVDVRLSDGIFSTRYCGEWTTDLTPRIAPGEPFGDGTWLVGPEIAPGRYRTTSDCAWYIQSGADGTDSAGNLSIGDEDAGVALAGSIAEIEPDDLWFTSRGCEWTADPTPRIAPGEPFGDGEWIVGSEVAPGLYVASELANPESFVHGECEWARLGDFRGGSSAYAYGRLAAIAEIDPANAAFRSSRCGEWTPYRGPAATPGQPFGDGVFLVGPEIAPGAYRTAAPPEGCQWERLRARGSPRWPRAAMCSSQGRC